MSPWSQWSDCYGDCDGYTSQKRSRNIVTEAKYGGTCQELDQKAKCDEKVNFEAWSEWTTCSQNCGDGTQTRSRVTQKHFNEKIDIECSDEKACFGDACLEDCRLSKWEAVSSCIGDCTGKGIRNMSRMVIEEAKSGGSCEYRLQKEEECEIGFTQWTKWSNCDCGEGIKRRTRNSQEQLEGGRLLYCPDDYVQKCNLEDCPSNVKEEKQDASNIDKLGSRSKVYLKSLIRDLDLELVTIIAMSPPTHHQTFLSRITLKSLHV